MVVVSLSDAVRFRAVYSSAVRPFLDPGERRRAVAAVCREWRRWERESVATGDPPCYRTLVADEIDAVVDALRALRMPWSNTTERYLRGVLVATPCLRDASDLPPVIEHLTRLYHRAVLPPKTNIGTLDTTRVIERLTQARLSKFHSTGVAALQQASSNLDTLLHPQQSTRRPQMIIRLAADALDTSDARTVLDHVRGRILATTVKTFVGGRATLVDALPDRAAALVEAIHGIPASAAVRGLCVSLDLDAMVWHNLGVDAVTRAVETAVPDAAALVLWERGAPVLYVLSRQLASAGMAASQHADAERWVSELPALNVLLRERWPCIADVFCAESSSVHGMLRLPTVNKSSGDAFLAWATALGLVVQAENLAEDCRLARRGVRGRSESRRRRGVRKWVVTNQDRSGTGGADTPPVVLQLLQWLMRALQLTVTHAPPIPAAFGQPVAQLVEEAVAGDNVVVRSLLARTAQLLQHAAAQSSRDETLHVLFTAVVWHLRGVHIARACPASCSHARACTAPRDHLEHLLLPQVTGTPVGGIPRITAMSLHLDAARKEWYICTEGNTGNTWERRDPNVAWGGNFLGLYTVWNGLAIDRRRCFTTNVVEILGCLGLEAVCAMFSAAAGPCRPRIRATPQRRPGPVGGRQQCQLQAARGPPVQPGVVAGREPDQHHRERGRPRVGHGRGPHRTAGPAARPAGAKHMRQAAFLGTRDNLAGSSANVLTGSPITFGTSGMTLLLDVGAYIPQRQRSEPEGGGA